MPATTFTFYDPIFGDTYHIDVDEEGEFIQATRYVEAVGRNPIVYDFIADLPRAHRALIERRLAEYSQ